MPIFRFRTEMPYSTEDLFAWHARPGALDRLLPPWQSIRVVEKGEGIQPGTRVVLEMGTGPIKQKWVARHQDYIENELFIDIQEKGPFKFWKHSHLFLPQKKTKTVLEDVIEYRMPFYRASDPIMRQLVNPKLTRVFRFRHKRTNNDLHLHTKYKTDPLKIAITGASGLIGSMLKAFLTAGGHEVFPLVRGETSSNNEIAWDPHAGYVEKKKLENMDAIIHLAGKNIASGRWNKQVKQEIRQSRVKSTQFLSDTLASLNKPPSVFLSASATGFYGDAGIDPVEENSSVGSSFLSHVCQEWETATQSAAEAGIRVVHMRLGMVLTAQGGALATMLTPFRLGVGGVVGSGKQMMSWIALDDLLGAMYHLLHREDIHGPVNMVSPMAVSNWEFTKTLGLVLRRPTLFPLPALAVNTMLGEMGRELLLYGANAIPTKLQKTEYAFLFPRLESALRFELGKFAKGEE